LTSRLPKSRRNVTLKDPLRGFTIAERGAVVLIAELQAQGTSICGRK